MLDAIIIGAGPAGLAAARSLADAGRSAVVLEARDRTGGRVWTDHAIGPVPVERGAEFIHGAAVRTWAWVRRAGVRTLPFTRWSGRRVALGGGRLAGPWVLRLRPDLRRLLTLEAQIAAYPPGAPECSLAEWLAAQRYSPLAAHIADLRIAHAACATPETLSLTELARELRASGETGGDFKILDGYDRALAPLAEGLDIRLGTPVAAVSWRRDGATVETAGGERLEARAVVVTVPLALLKLGAPRFSPALPEAKREAIERLAMGPAMKLILRFAEPFWDAGMTFLSADEPAPVWWTNRPGAPLLTAFLTGPRAARMASYGPEGALEAALGQLESIFGPAPRRQLAAWHVVDWAADQWARGGYSSTPPGAQGMRAALAARAGALHFAGEATSAYSPATVHGALESGERAAQEVIQVLR